VLVPEDDLFWPPTQRTEAEAHEVASRPQAWIFSFLGSRVQSFSSGPDRVIVYCHTSPSVDAWALGASLRTLVGPLETWTGLPGGWRPRQPWCMTLISVLEDIPRPPSDAGHAGNPPSELEPTDPPVSDIEGAIRLIKEVWGVTDVQIEAATGVRRSTLWRLRTGRTSEARSVTSAPLWRLRGLAQGLERMLSRDGARDWLHTGNPSPVSLLEAGDLETFERCADRILFQDPATARTASAAADDDYERPEPSADVRPPVNRRPRRAVRAPRRDT
jgi:hypothetical protein